jgi:hypothetical protein
MHRSQPPLTTLSPTPPRKIAIDLANGAQRYANRLLKRVEYIRARPQQTHISHQLIVDSLAACILVWRALTNNELHRG